MRRVPLPRLTAGERTVEGATGHYLARVLRLARGDRFEAFGGGLVAAGVIEEVSGERVRIVLDAPSERAATEAPVVWIHGIPKGDKTASIVQDATELGASAVVFCAMDRSVAVIADAKREDREARLRKIAEEAARQCGRADVPEIAIAKDLATALAAIPEDALKIALHPRDARALVTVLADAATAFVAGPEGGLTEAELAALAAAGFVRASLGARVLRTETVPAAVLGARACVLAAG